MTEYKDGTYTQNGPYESPAGDESVEVTITIKDDVITDLNITPQADHPMSLDYQQQFIEGIFELVLGKKISEIPEFESVNGSGLTPKGFHTALEKIKEQAKS